MRRDELLSILETFKHDTVFGRVFVNDTPTSVEAKYTPSTMEIRNLNDLPPYIRIGRGGEPTAETSENGVEWDRLESPDSHELQIYRLLDPILVLPPALLQEAAQPIPNEGVYAAPTLPLPENVKDFLIQGGDKWRWVRIRFLYRPYRRRLFSMAQKDFPPFTDAITIEFD